MTDLDLHGRRAIEALRSGVPNRDAVAVLGSGQPRIEAKFLEALDLAQDDLPNARQTPGLLIAGGFGAGKSHLLEHLQHLALQQNFICSKVVISKETPLFDPARFYRAALRAAIVPKRTGDALTEVAFSLKFDSAEVAALNGWANQPDRDLNSRFAASLFLFEHVHDDEWRSKLISFWAGDPINTAELRRLLRAHGQAATYPLERVAAADLPFQRFAFAPRLMVAAGYSGWVLLVDEVELIGRYSFRQRARSYAALARWAGKLTGVHYPGLLTLFAIVTEFEQAVLLGKNDVERIPGRLGATDLDTDRLLASQAERGMRFLSRERLDLQRPDAAAVERTYQQLRELHGRAYGWSPPEIAPGERLPSTSMREYVRRWINEWDLRRLYPDETVELGGERVELDFSESAALEAPEEPEHNSDLPF